METITVRVQGESDWVQIDLKIQDLNIFKGATVNLSEISLGIGRLLDAGDDKLTDEAYNELLSLIVQYVPNLEIYQTMVEKEMSSIFITSFRAKQSSLGYLTRIAGVLKHRIEDSKLMFSDFRIGVLASMNIGYVVLLKLISENPQYAIDKYHPESDFTVVKSCAKNLQGHITLKT